MKWGLRAASSPTRGPVAEASERCRRSLARRSKLGGCGCVQFAQTACPRGVRPRSYGVATENVIHDRERIHPLCLSIQMSGWRTRVRGVALATAGWIEPDDPESITCGPTVLARQRLIAADRARAGVAWRNVRPGDARRLFDERGDSPSCAKRQAFCSPLLSASSSTLDDSAELPLGAT